MSLSGNMRMVLAFDPVMPGFLPPKMLTAVGISKKIMSDV